MKNSRWLGSTAGSSLLKLGKIVISFVPISKSHGWELCPEGACVAAVTNWMKSSFWAFTLSPESINKLMTNIFNFIFISIALYTQSNDRNMN